MPEVNGWDCLKELKKDSPLSEIPVVMYSTSSHQRDREIAKELGAIGLITKPSDYTQLKKMLGKVVSFIKEREMAELQRKVASGSL